MGVDMFGREILRIKVRDQMAAAILSSVADDDLEREDSVRVR